MPLAGLLQEREGRKAAREQRQESGTVKELRSLGPCFDFLDPESAPLDKFLLFEPVCVGFLSLATQEVLTNNA